MKKPSTPAEILNNLIKEYGISVSKFAEDTKLSPSMVRQLISGKTKLTPGTAARLDKYFGAKSGEWLSLQYDAEMKEVKSDKNLQELIKAIPKAKKQKAPVEKKSGKKDASSSSARGRKKAAEDAAPKTRSRKSAAAKAEVLKETVSSTEPKKRGRPRSASSGAPKAEVVSAEPKKRGRKPKLVSADVQVKQPGKRGRKPKVKPIMEDEPLPEVKTHSILYKQDGRIIDSNDLPERDDFDSDEGDQDGNNFNQTLF
ncbi:MAG: HigA family addiction module antidote protein [Treponema sp.]|jgi:addiction module HigA family antidote|nr:HigA family addiction module antidote protein [Treponema sp.]